MPQPLKATCHCGNISLEVPHRPDEILHCKCTICRRYAAAWIYYSPKTVKKTIKTPAEDKKYVWGDKEIEFHWCGLCGCVTHWSAISDFDRMGVNSNNINPDDLRQINRKSSFGALRAKLRRGTPHEESPESEVQEDEKQTEGKTAELPIR